VVSKVMKGILVSKPSIRIISSLGIIIEFFVFLFYKLPNTILFFFGGVNGTPCILKNNDKF